MARKIAKFCDETEHKVSNVIILTCNPDDPTPVWKIKVAVVKMIVVDRMEDIDLIIQTNGLPQEKVSEIKSFLEGRNFEII